MRDACGSAVNENEMDMLELGLEMYRMMVRIRVRMGDVRVRMCGEGDLLISKIDIVPSSRLKDGSGIVFRMINLLELSKSQQPTQLLGVHFVPFIGASVNQCIFFWITGNNFRYIGTCNLGVWRDAV